MGKFKLFCIPHAGGSASVYSKWKHFFQPFVEVVPIELAGRGTRLQENLYHSMEQAVNDIYKQIKEQLDSGPYAILGHSMGALLAFELLNMVRSLEHNLPELIIFSGRKPPNQKVDKYRHLLSEEEFKKELSIMGGTPKELLLNEEILKIFIPIIRADIKIVETYTLREKVNAFDCDFLVINGKEDILTSVDEMGAWSMYSNRQCEIVHFNGGHFFLHENIERISQLIFKNLEMKLTSINT